MVELIDWEDVELENPGIPGWYTLAVTIKGRTTRPSKRVFAAVEHAPQGGACHVLLAAAFAEVAPEVLTPFSVTLRITVEGIQTFIVVGASRSKEFQARTP